jgi:uncharacterized membrane protein YhaH (DUF805 family)
LLAKKERPMLGFLFGFNARIGRLAYFLSSIGLGIFMAMLVVAIVFSVIHGSRGLHGSVSEILLSQAKWPLIITGAIYLLISLTLQSMRFRDIGWDPVCVIPAWIALLIIDKLIATKFPNLSVGHHGTIVGAVVNFGLYMALLFWPGSGDEGSSPPLRMPEAPPRRQDAASERIARITNGEFGRRSF